MGSRIKNVSDRSLEKTYRLGVRYETGTKGSPSREVPLREESQVRMRNRVIMTHKQILRKDL